AQARLFVDAAEDIRRLLHQFAAGFYKEPHAELLTALHEVVHAPLPADPPAEEAVDSVDSAEAAGPVSSMVPFEPLPAIDRPEAEVSATTWGDLGDAVQDIDDDIDVLDTIDVDLFPIFTEEAL